MRKFETARISSGSSIASKETPLTTPTKVFNLNFNKLCYDLVSYNC
jgi:hypothetical protein